MRRIISLFAIVAMTTASCGNRQSMYDLSSIADAVDEITRVEPLSWWVGMNTPLQLMINGEGISEFAPTICGPCLTAIDGAVSESESTCGSPSKVRITAVHKADSPNYLFIDIDVQPDAVAGTYYIIFSKEGTSFKYPYQIAERTKGSAMRKSFTTADMIYLVMPDRFANGDPSNDTMTSTKEKAARKEFFGRHGGDIQGIIDHLDYVSELGATAIWSTPLLLDDEPDGSYHGYACADYYHVDPRFGTNDLYKDFVEKAHEKGLKVIMDIVTNHCGTAHWWMKDLPFKDWIHQFPEYTGTNVCFSTNMDPNASRYDLNLQESGWFVPSMPDMNLDNPYMLQYFKQWAVWWIEFSGLDGFRVDTYPYNEKIPMSEWCAAILNEYPDFNIVGECWTSSVPQLAYWQGGNDNKDGFDSNLPSIMDFPLQEALGAALNTDAANWGMGMTKIYDCLSHDFVYHDLSKMMIFTGNHDTDRIGDVVKGDIRRFKLAMAMMATMRGFPQIFAGDEMMFMSKDLSQGHGGLRVDFPGGWKEDEMNWFTDEGRKKANTLTNGIAVKDGTVSDLFDYTKKLFQWRKEKEVIHNGKTLHFLSRDNTYAYFRYNETDAVFVFINNADKAMSVPYSHYSEITTGLHDGRNVLTGERITIDESTVVPAHDALVVEFKRQ